MKTCPKCGGEDHFVYADGSCIAVQPRISVGATRAETQEEAVVRLSVRRRELELSLSPIGPGYKERAAEFSNVDIEWKAAVDKLASLGRVEGK